MGIRSSRRRHHALVFALCGGCGVRVDAGGEASGAGDSTGAEAPAQVEDPPAREPAVPTSVGPGDGSDGGDAGFISDPDGDGAAQLCDTWVQDCPVGQKCNVWADDGGNSWNASKCVPIDPEPDDVGEPCTVSEWIASGADDCEIGAMCWHIDPVTLHGTCVPLCHGSEMNWSCPGLCTPCDIANEGTLLLCVPPCNPLAPTCGLGERCLGESSGWFASIACHRAPPGTSGIGELCHDSWDCVDGLLCVDDDEYPGCAVSPGCCTPYCDRAAADPCDALVPGTSCEPFYPGDAAPAGCGVDELGLCRLPRP